ncbi:MAG: hypothetical protein M9933_00940 [Chitinophagaceae bacterium]|nr:hypothetical protein [Chitinophagaceae bacterium]
MRYFFLLVLFFSMSSARAQTSPPVNPEKNEHTGSRNIRQGKSITDKKWFVSKYSSISAGYGFLYGGRGVSYVSTPIGLQLNRRLNNNLYAFAGVSAAPVFFSPDHPYSHNSLNKTYPVNGIFRSNNLGLYQRAEMGLMYMNDTKTFSISGSIGVQRGNYPVFPYPQMNTMRQTPVLLPGN